MILNPIIPIVLLLIIVGVMVWLVLAMPTRVLKILGIIVAVLVLIIGMRPMVPNGETMSFKSNVDVIFVMDNTLSMLAEDYNGNERRIDGVANDVEFIINNIPGAYYSLISFDNESHINVRSTVDANATVTAIKTVRKMDEYSAKGSSITIFKEDLKKVLEASNKKEGRKQIVFVMTDGENTSDEELESLTELRDFIEGGAVLGYGTEQGGKMKVGDASDKDFYTSEYSSYDVDGYLRDWNSDAYPAPLAVSKIDENNLKRIADELGVEYVHMEKQVSLKNNVNELKKYQELAEGENEYSYDDFYYFFCWPLAGVLLAMVYLMRREYL